MDLSPEKLRAEFWKKTAEREKINAKLDPLRDELNGLVAGDKKLTAAQSKTREVKVRDQISALQTELAPIERDRATLARALGGQTGERPS
jgi:predicted  nucleic acid-binding Zn-ribbon protein